MVSLFFAELILIFAFALEFLQLEQYLLLLLFGVAFIESNNNGKFRVVMNREFGVLIAGFTTFYFTMLLSEKIPLNAFYMLRYWLGPILAYYIGVTIGAGSLKRVFIVIAAIALGVLLHGSLNVLRTTDLSRANRSVVNFWTGSITSATLQGTYFVFGIALSASWLLRGKLIEKVLAVAIIGITVWNCMQTASRTALYLLGIILVCTIVLNEYFSNEKKGFSLFVLKAVFVVVLIAGVAVVTYQNDFMGMRTLFETSFLGQRLAGIEEEGAMSRIELWIAAIKNILASPMGISKYEHYAHNFWLDIGVSGGLAAMILVICYTCMSIKTMLVVFKRESDIAKKIMVYMIYLATTIAFMLEPILQAVPYTLCCFIMINGAIASLQHSNEKYRYYVI